MEIGVSNFPTSYTVDPAVLGKRAEELGFSSYWVPEHAIIPQEFNSPYPGTADGILPDGYDQIADPFITLARVAGATKTIKLGTGVCLPPEHNPLLLGKQVATLDVLSGGRFIFGIGAGWLREETEIMGGDFDHRWTQTREAIKVMRTLWTEDEAEHHGRYYDFPAVRSNPKPVQKPGPPVLLGSTAPNVFKRVVAWADGWMPTRATPAEIEAGRKALDRLAAEAGRDPSSITVVAYSAQPDREILKAYEDAGANWATHRVPMASEKESIEFLEDVARKVL